MFKCIVLAINFFLEKPIPLVSNRLFIMYVEMYEISSPTQIILHCYLKPQYLNTLSLKMLESNSSVDIMMGTCNFDKCDNL